MRIGGHSSPRFRSIWHKWIIFHYIDFISIYLLKRGVWGGFASQDHHSLAAARAATPPVLRRANQKVLLEAVGLQTYPLHNRWVNVCATYLIWIDDLPVVAKEPRTYDL